MDQAIHVEREIAAALLKVQRARDGLFDPNVFASPAWDIVLTLCTHPEGLSLFELHDEMGNLPEEILTRWSPVKNAECVRTAWILADLK